MKTILKISVILLAVLSGIALVWAKTAKVESGFEKGIAVETQSGLYNTNCARCHGGDGQGNTKLGQDLAAPDLTTSRMSSGRIKSIITHGEGDMPAYGKKLKAAQINSLVKYVRSLRK